MARHATGCHLCSLETLELPRCLRSHRSPTSCETSDPSPAHAATRCDGQHRRVAPSQSALTLMPTLQVHSGIAVRARSGASIRFLYPHTRLLALSMETMAALLFCPRRRRLGLQQVRRHFHHFRASPARCLRQQLLLRRPRSRGPANGTSEAEDGTRTLRAHTQPWRHALALTRDEDGMSCPLASVKRPFNECCRSSCVSWPRLLAPTWRA